MSEESSSKKTEKRGILRVIISAVVVFKSYAQLYGTNPKLLKMKAVFATCVGVGKNC
jgi:hypothetical protein